MLKASRLRAVLLAGLALAGLALPGLALPVLAQTPSPSSPPGTGRTAPPPAATTVPPATTPSPAARSTPAPAATPTPAPARAPAAAATTSPSPAATAAGGKVDVNSATEQLLDTLPGVGPALAKQIIAGRPWDDLNDLVKKKALPQGVFDRNKDRLALANINTSSAADMAKTLPGIGEVRSRAIVNGRPYATPPDLVAKKVLTQGQFDKIKDMVAY